MKCTLIKQFKNGSKIKDDNKLKKIKGYVNIMFDKSKNGLYATFFDEKDNWVADLEKVNLESISMHGIALTGLEKDFKKITMKFNYQEWWLFTG